MGNKNELNGERKNGICAGRSPDPVRTDRSRCADDRGRAVGDLTNGAVGFRLVRGVAVEGFNGRKTDEGRQREKRGEAEESIHNALTLIIYGDPKATYPSEGARWQG